MVMHSLTLRDIQQQQQQQQKPVMIETNLFIQNCSCLIAIRQMTSVILFHEYGHEH